MTSPATKALLMGAVVILVALTVTPYALIGLVGVVIYYYANKRENDV